MILSPMSRAALLAGVSFAASISVPALAQEQSESAEPARAPAPIADQSSDDDPDGGGGGIVVEGQRLRGQLDVEQAPILELGEADILAEGVTSISELVAQITQQTGSGRGRGGGGQPVILVNGIRIGSFREFADYPPEALARVEVFPEEVAQRFGFPPDRRVINLILKENYRNAEIELEFEGPTNGGNYTREAELGFLQIADGGRINVNLTAGDTSLLTEDERGIIQTPGSISAVPGDPDQAPFRSLVADSRTFDANISWAKAIIDSGTSLSANASYNRADRLSLQGLNSVLLTDGDGNSALRTFGADSPLRNVTAQDTFSTAGSLTRVVNSMRLTSTFDASLSESTQFLDRRFDTGDLQEQALAGTLAIDGALPVAVDGGFDTAFTRSINATTLTTLQGPIAYLPGGEVTATFDLGYDWTNLDTRDSRGNAPVSLTRGDFSTGANITVPITSRRNGFADALGSITLNGQIGLQHLSDFGTLGDYTVGLNWAPFDNLDLSATYIFREVAPGLAALGNPEVELLNVPVFDFVNGETVLATIITGGNPDLLAETQTDWKFAVNWELPFWEGTRFTVEYISNQSDDVTRGFPVITPEIEAAFPDRITRDANGTLTRIDRRFVTYAETRFERLDFNLFFRGSIGAGNPQEQRGGQGGGSGRPQRSGGTGASSGTSETPPAGGGEGPPSRSGEGSGAAAGRGAGGPPSAEQRAAFMEFRTRICADDGLEVLTRLIEAVENGEDLSQTIPGFDAQRFQGLLDRVRGEDGSVDPERLAALRERICSFDPSSFDGAGQRPNGATGPAESASGDAGGQTPAGPGRPGGPGGEFFASFRAIACGEDAEARLRALIARIDAGEDVSDELPGYDPNMASFILDRLRAEDGTISAERIGQLQQRFCNAEGGGQGGESSAGGGGGGGGPPGGFNPLARQSFPGFRYFVSLGHTINLESTVLIADGLEPLDELAGEFASAFGLPRHTSRLEAGIFGNGIGMRLSGRYTGSARLNGSELTGTSPIFFDDLATLDIRIFAEIGQLVGRNEGVLENVRVSFRLDNVFDAQRRVTDINGDTPLQYQPFLIDPVGRFIGLDVRKLF